MVVSPIIGSKITYNDIPDEYKRKREQREREEVSFDREKYEKEVEEINQKYSSLGEDILVLEDNQGSVHLNLTSNQNITNSTFQSLIKDLSDSSIIRIVGVALDGTPIINDLSPLLNLKNLKKILFF